jgi:hypothetical protein
VTPAAQLAKYVAAKFVKADPLDLVALCGLRIREVPAKGFDGARIRSKAGQKGIIAVKASIREASRKRFTIAHEIGHFIIPHHRNLENIWKQNRELDRNLNRPEMEANEFAAELLLPSSLAKAFNLSNSLAQISAVATEYGTTDRHDPFFSHVDRPPLRDDLERRQSRSLVRPQRCFPFFLPIAELPTDGSFAAQIFRGEAAPTELAPVRPDAWLDRQAAENVATLLEHSISLPSYNAVLTLLWAYKVETMPTGQDEEVLLDDLDPEDFTLNRRRWPR